MKLEPTVVIIKLLCYLCIGFFTPLGVGLAQWANSGEWPGRVVWVVIIASCCVGGATQVLSFLSGSYSTFKAKQDANFQTDFLSKKVSPPEPPKP